MIRKSLLFSILICIASVATEAQPKNDGAPLPSTARSEILPPLALRRADPYLRSAYRDVFGILNEKSECSDFYGGPNAAQVLNELIERTTKSDFPENVAITMSGMFSWRQSGKPGVQYRLFERTSVNRVGAFYRNKKSEYEPHIDPIGQFPAGTRAARALILLHELGHLIQTSDHKWLLPDDGGHEQRSERNTEFVQEICHRQLRSLR